ncbi:MAG: CpsD/CapB family tyrosine-protein kinase [Lactobacillus sp.]|nr:CpsD/CapB family tyrosine-protein kinase [Lactobacillus sp.]
MKKLLVDVVTVVDPDSPISEQYRTIRTNIEHKKNEENIQTIFLTSANSGEGKTTTIINLGVVFAKAGQKVLIVDCDIRKRSLSQMLGLSKADGIVSLLNSEKKLEDTIYQTNVANLALLPSGRTVKNPAELLLTHKLVTLVEELKERYDLILFDTPPILEVADAQILSTKLDRCVLVVRENYSSKSSIKKAKETLDNMGCHYLGIVHNYSNVNMSNYGYRGLNGKYGYGDIKSRKKKSIFNFWK